MTVKTYWRGHEIEWRGSPIADADGKHWFYTGTNEPANKNRPCARCNKPPTQDGHDACLGSIPGATSACCGHGIEPKYIVTGGQMSMTCEQCGKDISHLKLAHVHVTVGDMSFCSEVCAEEKLDEIEGSKGSKWVEIAKDNN